jgi:prepilin-type N-terminal cleavage/methylation domain-containing protein/prepilin-type processing-associated H-X9-DG protein
VVAGVDAIAASLHTARMNRQRCGFTLIELLVVNAIIALLIGILLPALGAARRSGRTTVCAAAQRGIGQALVLYANDYRELVVPSYTMTGTTGAGVPLEGWVSILDRDGYMAGATRDVRKGPFTCPDTLDINALANGQTGTDPNAPKGYFDWPTMRTGTSYAPQTIPERGFNVILRSSYWINAFNPIGATEFLEPDLHYTASVGYGPSTNGLTIQHTSMAAYVRPDTLIATADGVFAGRQRSNRIGTTNNRIGYRHAGAGGGAVNAAFADGHVRIISADSFPRGLGAGNDPAVVRAENTGGRPTVYANPEKALGL